MKLSYAVLSALLVVTTSGCAATSVPSRPIFHKPGASSAQIEADEARCVVQAIGETDTGLQLQPVAAIDRQAVYACMQGKGYQVVRPKA